LRSAAGINGNGLSYFNRCFRRRLRADANRGAGAVITRDKREAFAKGKGNLRFAPTLPM
jgi:hypothetical protein